RGGKIPVIAIAGNHDSPERVEVSDILARESGVFLVGYPDSEISLIKLDTGLEITKSDKGFLEVKLPETEELLRIITCPYANEIRLKTAFDLENSEEELRDVLTTQWKELSDKYCDSKGVNILIAHHFFVKKGDSEVETADDEKHILHVGGAQAIYTNDIPDAVQYTALGHLHRFHNVSGAKNPVVYSGSPIAYSFSEANQDKYFSLLDISADKDVEYTKIPIFSGKKLLRERFESITAALDWLAENPEPLLELTIVSDSYLSAEDRASLLQAHNGIIKIIPEIKSDVLKAQKEDYIDLNKDITELFKDYFKHKNAGQDMNESLLGVFEELLSK
ncbi:MAG: exonuclease sbcCD subunit D, partial [Flavobacteriaceae bacterium]|nr:exonuclease sbcCD subunit D [Flavobacteriaceae bacterium]